MKKLFIEELETRKTTSPLFTLVRMDDDHLGGDAGGPPPAAAGLNQVNGDHVANQDALKESHGPHAPRGDMTTTAPAGIEGGQGDGGGGEGQITTLALGEEGQGAGDVTTTAPAGIEGGQGDSGVSDVQVTTRAVGEEGQGAEGGVMTRAMVGAEAGQGEGGPGGGITTRAMVGVEAGAGEGDAGGGKITTLALGEEGGGGFDRRDGSWLSPQDGFLERLSALIRRAFLG